MRSKRKLVFALAVLIVPAIAGAQSGDAGSGCDMSPENPTLLLAALGSCGAAAAVLRSRWQKRKSEKNSERP